MSRLAPRKLNQLLLASTAMLTLATGAYAGSLGGTVTDQSGTAGLGGAEVTVVETGHTVTTSTDGAFRFGELPAGNYTLSVSYAGAQSQTRTVSVPETGLVRSDFNLTAFHGGETVLVIGQRANLTSNIQRQRAADGVQTTLSRDAIGQFPDQNVAESLRRAPGINVLNDQDEGRYVSVRGLDPNLNSASVNGNRLLATGGDERAVALDVIPSELIESIDIKKSLTPDMDGDTIGGSIEINTTSAFDRKKNLFSVSLEGSYHELSEKTSLKGGFDFSYRLTPDLGVAGGLTYNKRHLAADNIEAEGWEDDGFARGLEYRDYDVTRERYGATLNFDWRVSEDTSLYLRTFYSKFDDTELRKRLIFKIDDLNPTVDGNTATFVSGDGGDERIEIRRDIKDRGEWQETSNIAVGGKSWVNDWKLSYDLSLSEARQSEKGSLDPVRFSQRFDKPNNVLGVRFDYSDMERPAFEITEGADNFNDPTRYSMTAFEHTTLEAARDREVSLRFDAARTFTLDTGALELKFGAKLRQREKSLDMEYNIFGGYDGDLSLADVAGSQTYSLHDLGIVPDLGKTRDFVSKNYANFELEDYDTQLNSIAEDYKAKENINAAYVMGRYDAGKLRLVGGVRVEDTAQKMSGQSIIDDDGDLIVTPVSFENNYTDVLPSLNLRYEASENVIIRGAAYASVMRPSFGDMAPRFMLYEDKEGEFGNPDLKPYRAANFDFSVEYYFSPAAMISGGVFYKDISDFIVDYVTDDSGTYNGIAYDKAEWAINGDKATVTGFEFSYNQALTFLPSPWDGLLLGANYTYIDAEGTLNDGRVIPLVASSKHTGNIMLGYEKGPLSLRIAGAYRSGYLDEVTDSADEDRYVKDHFQVDLSAKYRVSNHVRLFAEVVNMNNATYTAYQNRSDAKRLLQYDKLGWTAKFGVKLNY